MLNECAPNHRFSEGQHKFQVGWKGLTWPSLPRGKKGDNNPEIFVGHVRAMVRFLKIPDDCAKRMLPRLN